VCTADRRAEGSTLFRRLCDVQAVTRPLLFTALLSLSVSLAAGCGGSIKTDFPPGLTPLEDDTAPEPAPNGSDTTPEAYASIKGDRTDYEFAMLKGYIHAPIAKVYEGLKDPPTVVNRRNVSSYSVTWNVETGYDVSFRVHNVVNSIVTVEFDNTWREGVVGGTKNDPAVVAGRSSKTSGTAYITSMDVSVVLTKVSDSVTKVELVEHINSATSSADTIEQYLGDFFDSLRAHAHGQPLPTY
jgi:hypothetical protein